MADVDDTVAAIDAFGDNLAGFASRLRAEAFNADNANLLENSTSSELLDAILTRISAHTTNMNNPHGLTAAEIGSVTKTVVDEAMNKLLSTGVIPISFFDNGELGVNAGTALKPFHVVADPGQNRVTVQGVRPANTILNGFYYQLPAIPEIVVSGENILRIYVQREGSRLVFVPVLGLTQTVLPETATCMQVLYLRTGVGGIIQTLQDVDVLRIDNYRISNAPTGTAISATGGNINQSFTALNWF